ncbi:MAG: cation:proton antiporter [Muribaculaceae bacterium]|nr:cation:proton antiporter [Muribaculaceae bacterium]
MDWSFITSQLPLTNSALIFFIVLTIILFAPIILDRLHIPHIIGLIFSGMLIGPYGFNILEYDASFEIFGNVGLLYLMFLVGLEMSISDFNKNKKRGISFGLITFIIPLLAGLAVSHYALKLSWVASALLSTIYASHTLISFPIVSRYGVVKSRSVSTAIAGTVIAVVVALTTMAVAIGIAEGGVGALYWIKFAIGVILYGAVIIYTYPRITRWFFKKYNDNVSQFIFILSLVFAAAYFAELVGLVGIIGAFFAGIILTRYIPAVSPLMNRLEFVGNALFIPYFLIGVGMMINLRGFTSWYSIYVALIMTAVAIASKWLSAYVMQKSFRMTSSEGRMLFGLSTAKAAATLAVVLIGYEMGLFDSTILNGAILMILISCTVSALFSERAAKEIALSSMNDEEPQKTEKLPQKILVSVSNPMTAELLVNMAMVMKNPKVKNPLYFLNVVNEARHDNPASAKISSNLLTHASKIAAAADIQVETITRFSMNVASGIIHTMKEKGISELLIGIHHKANIADSFFGSTADAILRGTNKTIFIAKSIIPANTLTRIIVYIPEKAEYETGFGTWVSRVANMAAQLGCKTIFYGHRDTLGQIKGRLIREKRNIRAEYHIMDKWNDILMLTGVVLEDDLFIIVSARQASVSYTANLDKLPSFLSKYFANNNLVILYPEQFGEVGDVTYFSDPLSITVHQNHAYINRIKKYLTSLFKSSRAGEL